MWDLQEEGYVTSERRVRRLARAEGLQCVHPGPSARTTVQDSKAIGGLVDLVDRQFTAPEPDQLWVGDITYIWTYSGFAYLATLIDMCSNKVGRIAPSKTDAERLLVVSPELAEVLSVIIRRALDVSIRNSCDGVLAFTRAAGCDTLARGA